MVVHPQTAGRPIGLLVKVFPKLSETFVLEEVLGLERLGLPLVIYCLAPAEPGPTHGAVGRVRSPRVAVPSAPWRTAPLQLLRRHARLALTRPLAWLDALRRAAGRGLPGWGDFARAGWLAGQLREDGVAHLHAHFISQPAELAAQVSALGGMPFSISAHAKDIYLSEPTDLRRRMRAARFTVTCTDFNCRSLRAIAPEAEVRRMYHGIDADVFHPRRRSTPSLVPMILSVGRLRPKKGLDTLVAACARLAERGVPFRCEIVGYGDELPRLQAAIAAAGLAGQVHLAGRLAREEVLERYARAAVYVQPSRVTADGDRDGIPNVLLEAMACAVPVVATRVSGIPELVQHGTTGLLVEPDDADALADAITRVLDEPGPAAERAARARTAVTTDFDNRRNLRLLLQLLETSHAHAACPAVA